MSVTVDGEMVMAEQDGLKCVGEVLDRLTATHRLVTNVLLDGREPNLDELSALRETPLDGHVVYLETATAAEVAGDVLEQAILRLDEAERDAAAAADLVQQTDATDGVTKLGHAFSLWSEAQEAVAKVLQLFGFDAAAFELPTTMNELAAHLREIKQAVERQDYVTLADVLQYDLPATLSTWRASIEQLRGVVTAKLAA